MRRLLDPSELKVRLRIFILRFQSVTGITWVSFHSQARPTTSVGEIVPASTIFNMTRQGIVEGKITGLDRSSGSMTLAASVILGAVTSEINQVWKMSTMHRFRCQGQARECDPPR